MSKRTSMKVRNRSRAFETLESRRVLTALSGFVFEDVNADRNFDVDTDLGIPGVVVYLDTNRNGQLDQSGFGLDPDEYQEGEVLNNSRQTIFPSTTGIDNQPDGLVLASSNFGGASTGDLVFGHADSTNWTDDQRLRFDFTLPTDSVSLDVQGTAAAFSTTARLDAYSSNGTLLESDTVGNLLNGSAGRLSIRRAQSDVQFVVAHVTSNRGSVFFDNLRVDDSADERSTITTQDGFYSFPIEADNQEFAVSQQLPEGYFQTSPFPDTSYITPIADAVANLNFGNRTSSIGGLVFNDAGIVGTYEPGIDEGIAGAALYLDINENGEADATTVTVDPGVFLEDQVLNFVASEVQLSVVDANNVSTSELVTSAPDELVSQDGQLFTRDGEAAWTSSRRLRMDFETPASSVTLDFIGASDIGQEQGILVAYSAAGTEIASTTTGMLDRGEQETLTINRSGFDISYAIAYTVDSPSDLGRLDNLQATIVAEPVAISDNEGDYIFKPLSDGQYRVAALPFTGRDVTLPSDDNVRQISVEDGEDDLDVDFGLRVENESPVANADTAETVEEGLVVIGVLENDVDPDGSINTGSVEITQNPLNGTAVVTPSGLINYTPNVDFSGTDTLIYTFRDDQAAVSNSATVTITVVPINDAPRTTADSVAILGTTSTAIDVLRNDIDVDGSIDRSTVAISSQPGRGTVDFDSTTGLVTYTSTLGGNDSFTYTVADNDGLRSAATTVTINSLAAGIAPVAANDVVTTFEGTRRDISVLANDSDADGTLSIDSIAILTLPQRGSLTMSNGIVNYQPNLGFVGADSFTYQVRDNTGLASNEATVSITMSERDFPFQNPIDARDVRPDGIVVPRDALIIINEINNRQVSDPITGEITTTLEPGVVPASYYDVTGDGFIVANDVLRVINFINAQGSAAEPPVQSSSAIFAARAAAAAFATNFDPFEEDDDEEA